MKLKALTLLLLFSVFAIGEAFAKPTEPTDDAPQWQEFELEFTATKDHTNAYTEVEAWVEFVHEGGTKIKRPTIAANNQRRLKRKRNSVAAVTISPSSSDASCSMAASQ